MSRPDILGCDSVLVFTWKLCRDMAQPGHDRVGMTGPGCVAIKLLAAHDKARQAQQVFGRARQGRACGKGIIS